jgi:hypothetical protein
MNNSSGSSPNAGQADRAEARFAEEQEGRVAEDTGQPAFETTLLNWELRAWN